MPQPIDPKGIDAIIFDIGNVLVDIDYEVMVGEFQKIAKHDFSQIVSYARQENFFDLFEKGKISAAEFRSSLRQYLRDDVTDEEIDRTWNAIMIRYPAEKFELLHRLRGKYKLYALSNINEIHIDVIDRHVKPTFRVPDMRSYFDYAFYSHEMGYRKPEREIYQAMLDHAHLDPAHTLFIDDKAENIEAAAALGIQTYHLTDRDSLPDVLSLF